MRTIPARLIAALAFALSSPILAQQATDYSKVEVTAHALAEDLHVLDGAGGAVSVLSGPDGVLLVDSQFAPLTDKLVAAIRTFTPAPIRFRVNTHVHGDHTGGNENFAALGATVFSREQLRERLIHPVQGINGTTPKPAAGAALPLVTYDGPVTFHLDGEEVRLIPTSNGHTDGDTLVQFVHHDVLAVGDYFRSVGYPVADINNGGSFKGLLAELDATIALAGPNTRIVPGHGPVTNRQALVAQRALIVAVRDRIAPLVAQGRSLEQVTAAHPTAEFDDQVPQAQQTAERFVKWLYAEIRAGRA
jgi:cyclase